MPANSAPNGKPPSQEQGENQPQGRSKRSNRGKRTARHQDYRHAPPAQNPQDPQDARTYVYTRTISSLITKMIFRNPQAAVSLPMRPTASQWYPASQRYALNNTLPLTLLTSSSVSNTRRRLTRSQITALLQTGRFRLAHKDKTKDTITCRILTQFPLPLPLRSSTPRNTRHIITLPNRLITTHTTPWPITITITVAITLHRHLLPLLPLLSPSLSRQKPPRYPQKRTSRRVRRGAKASIRMIKWYGTLRGIL